MKFLFLLLISTSFGAEFICNINPTANLDRQIRLCKSAITKHECEQQGIQIWSNTQVENNSLTMDKVQSIASCDNLKITVTQVKKDGNQLLVTYNSNTITQQVTTVSMEQWTDLDIASKHVTGTATIIEQDSNSTIVNVGGSFQIDSKVVMQQYARWTEKGKKIINILVED